MAEGNKQLMHSLALFFLLQRKVEKGYAPVTALEHYGVLSGSPSLQAIKDMVEGEETSGSHQEDRKPPAKGQKTMSTISSLVESVHLGPS